MSSVLTTVCVEEVMEVLQELSDFYWTWTNLILFILSEAQQHIHLLAGHKSHTKDNILTSSQVNCQH